MNNKNILVSFLVIASVLFLSTVSATTPDFTVNSVKINDVSVSLTTPTTPVVAISSGDTVNIEVQFTANVDDSKVKLRAELYGTDVDVTAVSSAFVVETNNTYVKTFSIKVPTDLKDSLSDNLFLDLKVGDDTEVNDIRLSLQRPSQDVAIKSVITDDSVQAGQLLPVDVVLKNVGYNDLSDLYVTVSIDDLKLSKTAYFGDLVPLITDDTNENDKTSVSGRVYLQVPYDVKSGTYTITVTAGNTDTASTATSLVTINNGFPDIAIKSGNTLTLLNPTNSLVVYTVNYQSNVVNVIVPAESSKDVAITVPTSGDYNFDVTVYSGSQLVDTVNFTGTGQAASQLTSPVLVLTVILAIVFLVLLVVLIVLVTRKPQKAEEFGESYY